MLTNLMIVNIGVNILMWGLILYFFKVLFNNTSGLVPLTGKVILLGFEGMIELLKPFIKWIFVFLMLLYLGFNLVPETTWEKVLKGASKTKEIAEVLGFQPQSRPNVILVVFNIFFVLPLKAFFSSILFLLTPISVLKSLSKTTYEIGITPAKIVGLLMVFLWSLALYRAAKNQVARLRGKQHDEMFEKHKENDIETIKEELKNGDI